MRADSSQFGRVSNEGNPLLNRHFYTHTPPRPLAEIEADIKAVEQEIVRMLAEVSTGQAEMGIQSRGRMGLVSDLAALTRFEQARYLIGRDEGGTTMETIRLQSYVGPDGILKLQVPIGTVNSDLEVVLIVQPVPPASGKARSEDLGWPPGFFERTFGSFRAQPLMREPQGEYETREELE